MRDTLRIGEFSALGRVSVRMLRHYEKLGLLAPAETDAFTSYRYYTLDQLPRLNRIIALKELGFSLEQVGGILAKNPTADEMRRCWMRADVMWPPSSRRSTAVSSRSTYGWRR